MVSKARNCWKLAQYSVQDDSCFSFIFISFLPQRHCRFVRNCAVWTDCTAAESKDTASEFARFLLPFLHGCAAGCFMMFLSHVRTLSRSTAIAQVLTLLNPDGEARCSAQEALHLPWLKSAHKAQAGRVVRLIMAA